MSEYERARAELLEVHAAVTAYPGEDVTFDALASFEGHLLDRLIRTPATSLADVREKIAMHFQVLGGPLSESDDVLASLADDLDRLFPEHAPKPAKEISKRSKKGKAR